MNYIKSAYRKLNVGIRSYGTVDGRITKAEHSTILWALEKQIPDMVIRKTRFSASKCPVCESFVSEGQSYCKNCGQRLDWSEV